ncbi:MULTISPECIES: TetR/AcrR family transcriptional regulator [unclassified Mycolicibacterium]|uniref:TetR/AcrR family transcriptional regulator n=1 Tax=unclassified Mycolicibacterium TaxID=2636767 RepID=UPI001391F678|nr:MULTISPECIES: TetR/AcrR family transcriptional regulator C-terminal domain-containing protein [unclassified Mycolicibacterium]
MGRSQGVQTKSRPKLNRDSVATAAIALIERDGLETLTMRALADELRCGTMSLYSHVRNRDDLLESVVELLIRELDTVAQARETWQQAIRRVLGSYRDLAVRHPRTFELLALAPYDELPVAPHLARVLCVLQGAGLNADQASHVLAVADAYATGFLVVWARSQATHRQDDLPTPWPMLSDLRHLDGFERGLATLIAGLEATLGSTAG